MDRMMIDNVAAQQITAQVGADALTGLDAMWAEVDGAR